MKVLVVARAIFMRQNPGAAEDGSVKVFIVARVIFERRKQKKYASARGGRCALFFQLPPTPTAPRFLHQRFLHRRALFELSKPFVGAAGPVAVTVGS